MQTEVLKKVIESQRSEIEGKFRKEEMVERDKLSFAERYLKHPNILAILGIRRCGKSVFSVMLAKRLAKDFGYINFDDERLAGMKTTDLDKILQAFFELYGNVDLIVLDEVQNVEKWELFASRLRRTKRVIITGSNSQLLGGELATALTGRHIDVALFPFSFKEVLDFKPNIYLTEDAAKAGKAFRSYLKGSGFPEYRKFGQEIVMRIYEDIINKDCIRRYEIRNEESFREIARYLITNFSTEFTYSRLSKLSSVKDIHTVKNYVNYLKRAFIIHVLERFSFKLKQQIIAPKKAYVIDHGFANFLALGFTKNKGKLFENVVCVELLNRFSAEYGIDIFYYKDARGFEVDFIVKEARKVKQLIQVCYDINDTDTKEREMRALLIASRELKCRNLVVITGDFEGEEQAEHSGIKRNIRFVPLWKWLLNKG